MVVLHKFIEKIQIELLKNNKKCIPLVNTDE